MIKTKLIENEIYQQEQQIDVIKSNLQFRQLGKIITKSEQLAKTDKLSEITEDIIKGIIDEE